MTNNQKENRYHDLCSHASLTGGVRTRKFKCPLHPDNTPSGVISIGDDGKILGCCHSCENPFSEILSAWGFEMKDAFPPEQDKQPIRLESPARREAEYMYSPTLKKVKMRHADGGKHCFWQHLAGDKWVNGRGNEPHVLYTNGIDSDGVFLVEGEGDVETLRPIEAAAVSLPDGAKSKWLPEYAEFFLGKMVCIIQDNDEPGKAFAQRMAADLQGIAFSVKVLDLAKIYPEIPHRGDTTDLIQHMGANDGIKALLELTLDTPEWDPVNTSQIIQLEVSRQDEWDEPIPFDTINTPDFPTECLPAPVAAFVEALAESTQTPTEMAAVLSLGVLATAFQSKFEVEITPDWKEPLCLYTVAIAPPGEKKSAVIGALTRPVYSYEAERREAEAIEIRQNQDERSMLEQRLEAAKKSAAKAKGESALVARQEALDISAELAEFKDMHPYRLVVDDTTPEKLVDIMDTQGGCITVSSAEGGLFDSISGRYDKSSNFDIYLKGHAGDPITVDRIGRKPNYVKDPRLTMMLTIQPEVVTGLMENATFRGRGLCGRFMYSRCRSKVGYRNVNPSPIPYEVKNQYSLFVKDILSNNYKGTIRLSEEAQKLRIQYAETIERRLVDTMEHMRDWGGKAVGAMLRIAALIHASEVHVNPTEVNVSAETVAAAIKITEVLCVHAMAIYQDMGTNEALEDAKYLLRRIGESGQDEISKRDLFDICKGKFKKVDVMEPALQTLIDMGYVKEIEIVTGGRGRPSKKVILNPMSKNSNISKITSRVS